MPHVNNIYNIKVNNISSNGSVDFGSAIYKGLSANAKSQGGQTIVGNSIYSPNSYSGNASWVTDPDAVDQGSKQL
ncbi:spore germination protein [Paenibacillus turpanensis]|uniref:spore germination protein n=1 Tax=Paenibacillus turpanensis TaxID=2689078 RepID=UPI00140DBDAD|nr:spore germination protein [Paenibacillus turpanensis]